MGGSRIALVPQWRPGMRRLILACCLLFIAAGAWWFGSSRTSAVASQPLTGAAIAQIEPELCSESALTQLLTIVPIAPRSLTRSMDIEQLTLVDQHKDSGLRKVWVLRLPAAYITQRTCDFGRKNWIGSGDYLRVTQLYELSLVLMEDQIVPATRAIEGKQDAGLFVTVGLNNRVWHPAKRHQMIAQRAMVNGRIDINHPQRCREEEGEIPGLVRFRRIDPNERGGTHCGSRGAEGTKWENKVYGKKIGELTYEFIVKCSVNCRIYTDYNGWDVELMFPYNQLKPWSFALA